MNEPIRDRYDPFEKEPPKLFAVVNRNYLTLHQFSFWDRLLIAFGILLHGSARLPDLQKKERW